MVSAAVGRYAASDCLASLVACRELWLDVSRMFRERVLAGGIKQEVRITFKEARRQG